MLDYRHSTGMLAASGINRVIISVGATEQCGPCLPFHLDSLIAEYCAGRFGTALNAFVLPTFPFNTSEEHSNFKGTIWLAPSTMLQIMQEVVTCLRSEGFNKQVLCCGHGGSYWKHAFLKHINNVFPDIVVVDSHFNCRENWQQAMEAAGIARDWEIHGGLLGKCTALYLCKDCVIDGPFGSPVDPQMNAYADYGVWEKIAPSGSWGYFSEQEDGDNEALREKGRILWETFADLQCKTLKEHFDEVCRVKDVL